MRVADRSAIEAFRSERYDRGAISDFLPADNPDPAMTARRQLLALTALVSLLGSTGCSMLHELKPHRLWRLNQASSPMSGGSAAYYSIPELPRPDADE